MDKEIVDTIEAEIIEQITNDARQFSKDAKFGTYSEGFLQMGYEIGAATYYIAGRSKSIENLDWEQIFDNAQTMHLQEFINHYKTN